MLGIWDSLYLQLNQHNALVKAIPVRRVEKGQLLEYILTDLRVPHSYEVRLTPYTTFGAGDMASRIIHYTERRWWWRRWRWDRWAHLMLRGPSIFPAWFLSLGFPNLQCPTLLLQARCLWPPVLLWGPCFLVLSPGTLCTALHLGSNLVFLLAFSAISSPNLSGEIPLPTSPSFRVTKVPRWEEGTPKRYPERK